MKKICLALLAVTFYSVTAFAQEKVHVRKKFESYINKAYEQFYKQGSSDKNTFDYGMFSNEALKHASKVLDKEKVNYQIIAIDSIDSSFGEFKKQAKNQSFNVDKVSLLILISPNGDHYLNKQAAGLSSIGVKLVYEPVAPLIGSFAACYYPEAKLINIGNNTFTPEPSRFYFIYSHERIHALFDSYKIISWDSDFRGVITPKDDKSKVSSSGYGLFSGYNCFLSLDELYTFSDSVSIVAGNNLTNGINANLEIVDYDQYIKDKELFADELKQIRQISTILLDALNVYNYALNTPIDENGIIKFETEVDSHQQVHNITDTKFSFVPYKNGLWEVEYEITDSKIDPYTSKQLVNHNSYSTTVLGLPDSSKEDLIRLYKEKIQRQIKLITLIHEKEEIISEDFESFKSAFTKKSEELFEQKAIAVKNLFESVKDLMNTCKANLSTTDYPKDLEDIVNNPRY